MSYVCASGRDMVLSTKRYLFVQIALAQYILSTEGGGGELNSCK